MLALCKICHFAFDHGQWCFLPEQLAAWLQEIKASPQRILHYNTLEDVNWRRFLLQPDPQSAAFQDTYFRAAFSDIPVKHWPGEVGSVIIRNASILGVPLMAVEPATKNAVRDYRILLEIWIEYQSPCSLQDCRLCSPRTQEEANITSKDNGDIEEDEEEEEDKDGNDEDDENGDDEDKDEKDTDKKMKNKKTLFGGHGKKPRTLGTAEKMRKVHVSRYGKKARLPSKAKTIGKPRRRPGQERDWLTTEPYDENVPYSHRYGYTYAHATSNDRIRYWCIGHGLPFEPPEPPAYVKTLQQKQLH